MKREDVERVWPERLKIRDTGLHDDLGGPGQRICTTAGRGYERVEYVRADLYATLLAERDAAYRAGQAEMRGRAEELYASGDGWDYFHEFVRRLRALPIKPRP